MLQKLFHDEKIEYKLLDSDSNIKLYKVSSKCLILYIKNYGNQFTLNRDFFEYLDGNSLPYKLLLHDAKAKKIYFLELKKENNWVKSCFATCDKDEIFLGKQVLNYSISKEMLAKKLK